MSTAFVTAAPLRVGAPSIGRVARRTRTVQLPVVPKRCAPAFILRNRSARGRGSRAYIYASTPPPEEPSAKEPPPDAEVVVVTEEGAADDAAGKKRVWTWRGPDGLAARVVSALKSAFAPGGFAWGLVAGAALAAGVLFIPDSGVDAVLREKVAIFDFILQDINASYVDRVDIDKLFETGVNSMLGTLDPYTQFENNSEALEMSLRTSGRYAGVGLGISAPELALPGTTLPEEGDGKTPAKAEADKTRDITVVSAFEGYAFDAGVRPGDVILEVGGQNVDGLTLEKVTDLLRGEAGTSVDIRVRREGHASPLKFTLQRSSVHIRDVPVSTLLGVPADGIGYIRLQSFAKDAAAEVRTAFSELVKTAESAAPGKGLRGLVLDLRGNPGGLLNAAIEVSETLVPRDSVIVSTRGRGMGAGPAYRSSREPDLPARTRLAVLVDGQTASASEIVAGAVQDLDVGIVVGSRTFGKGLVQNVQELPYRTALKYTVG